jgi:uncharacterized protein YkwD
MAQAASCESEDFAVSVLARINELRAAGADCGGAGEFEPAPRLDWNVRLKQAAHAHSNDMAERNYFSHVSADGRSIDQRVMAAGYAPNVYAENIAAGYASIDLVLQTWMASDTHCAQLMNPRFTEVGMACMPGNRDTTYSSYWTLDFARGK